MSDLDDTRAHEADVQQWVQGARTLADEGRLLMGRHPRECRCRYCKLSVDLCLAVRVFDAREGRDG